LVLWIISVLLLLSLSHVFLAVYFFMNLANCSMLNILFRATISAQYALLVPFTYCVLFCHYVLSEQVK